MGAPRSAKAALAVLLAGSVCAASLARAQEAAATVPDAPVTRSAAVEPAAPAPEEPAPGSDAAPVAVAPGPSPEPRPAEMTGAVSPQADPAPVPNAASAPEKAAEAPPPVPADPLSAAVTARLSSGAPLLPRFGARDRESLQAVYALGAFKPVWIVDGRFTPAATAAAARLARAGEDGLDPAAYPVPVLAVTGRAPTEAEIADADLRLSAAVALYARDARGGRINPTSLSRLVTPVLDLPSPDAVVGRIAAAGTNAGDLLQAYNPHEAGYLALKSRLASLRGPAVAEAPALKLPPGPILRVGMRDPRVPQLRARFGLETRTAGTLDAAPGDPETYDAAAAAVSAFQRERGLAATGALNAQTVVALASPAGRLGGGEEASLLVNMERWRWLPADLGPDYVMVNVPEYRLRVFRDGRLRDETRVIVGKTESPTPIFSGMMEYAVVNPSWHVPPSILKNEFLPGLARDPSYAARRGYEVVRRGNSISVRQPPGERNALGFIKFMFPNNHAVYLHDTPNRSLFARSERALSHGCVRVDDPFRFADSVLPAAWTSERLKKLIGKGERTVQLGTKLPVHLAYFTAYVDDAGRYRTLPDLYGYDARMRTALGLPGGAPAMVRAPAEPARVVSTMPAMKPAVKPAAPPKKVAQRPTRAAPEYGEPGLMTPVPESPRRSFGWW